MQRKTYYVVKIFDQKTQEPEFESRMYGQEAYVYVPSKKTIKVLETGDKKKIAEYAEETSFKETWSEQDVLAPIIGQPLYFSSLKMDAGWYRSSAVKSFVFDYSKKRCIVKTQSSVLMIWEAD